MTPATLVRRVAGVVVASLGCGAVAFAAAQAGTASLYLALALAAAGAVVLTQRDLLVPVLADAIERARPRPNPGAHRPGRARRVAALITASSASGAAAWLVAQQGTKAIAGLGAVLVLGTGGWLAAPLLRDLCATPPVDVVPRPRRPGRSAAPDRASVPERPRPARMLGAALAAFAVAAAGTVAWAGAQLGIKGLVALVGLLAVVACLVYVRDRTVFFTFVSVASLAFVLHKSFSAQDLELSGGAPSIYVSTFDAMILVLYALWMAEGTFLADVRAGFRRRIVRIPLVGALFLLPSLLAAQSVLHGASELVRMGWMYALFFYVAVRVRTRRHVWAVLAGLAVLACVELVVVVLQWKTGGVGGIAFLGVPTELGERVTDANVIGRPFGTIIHPVFMGAVMASLGLLALSVGLALPRSLTKVAALTLVAVSLLPLYLAHTRAALVASAMVGAVVVGVAVARGWLARATLARVFVVALVATALAWPSVSERFIENFTTGHFSEEVDSRRELNDLAGEMIADHPVVGVGLNNFERAMGPYEQYGVIFFDNPVHNLYLLFLAETGVVGFVGVLVVGIALYDVAIRLARVRDRLYAGIGLGVAAVMAFFMVEELLGFSLRQDIPLALYWLLAGLAVACARLERDRPTAPATSSLTSPAGDPIDLQLRHVVAELRGAGANASRVAERREALAASAGALAAVLRARTPTPPRDPIDAPLGIDEVLAMLDALAAGAAGTAARSHAGDPGSIGLDEAAAMLESFSLLRAKRRRSAWSLAPPVALAVLAVAGLLAARPGGVGATERFDVADLLVTFSATERATGVEGIFVGRGDGSEVRRITPDDGRIYSWPAFALGGTKIVFTARHERAQGGPENVYWMDVDGSHLQQLTDYDFPAAQPKVTADGRAVVFTAANPRFREVGLFRLDLRTLEATNLSSVTMPAGAADADPRETPRGDRIVLASTRRDETQIELIDADGTDRIAVTADSSFNTDPVLSADERSVAYSSYRGPGHGRRPHQDAGTFDIRLDNWLVVVRDLASGAERTLTDGLDCASRTPLDPCAPGQSSGWQPLWTPDAATVGYIGVIDQRTTCVCATDHDGSNRRSLIRSSDLAITWFDWVVPSSRRPGAVDVGSQRRDGRLLVTATDAEGGTAMHDGGPDLMRWRELDVEPLVPADGRWSSPRDRVVFSAPVEHLDEPRPYPAPPPGSQRRDHVTLSDLDPRTAVDTSGSVDSREQVFLRDASGHVTQLTTPWIEDWRDGVAPGDARANTQPVLSPDGRWVVFTNRSSRTGESFLLRLDLRTGDVLNLTNGTAGILRVDDAHPSFSPDGSRIAFTWTQGEITDVYVMNTVDGREVLHITDDVGFDRSPAWSPDGRSIVYVSHEQRPAGADDIAGGEGWSLVKVAVDSGERSVLVGGSATPLLSPVWSPVGDRVAYVGAGATSLDVFVVDAGGATPPRSLQVTPLVNERSVDWR